MYEDIKEGMVIEIDNRYLHIVRENMVAEHFFCKENFKKFRILKSL